MNRLIRLLAIALFGTVLAAPALSQPPPLDDAGRAAAVAKAADLLRNRYVFPDVGEQAAAKIEAALAAGDYNGLDSPAFAERLTADLYAVAKDQHLRIRAPGQGPPPPPGGRPGVSEGGFVRADRLPGNIGYIEVVGFPPPEVFSVAADRAMASIADTRALIIDVRRNGGGSPGAVAYLVSFFLDPAKPPLLINDFQDRIPGTKDFTSRPSYSLKTPTAYLNKPVYVLTSAYTFSGGEEFAYDMQAFRLGTLVGETTGGGANPGGITPIGGNLSLFVPGGRPINPVTKTNWEGVGVIPEIKTPVEDALKVALEKLGETPTAKDVATLSQAKLFSARTEPTPGGDAILRRNIEALARGKPDYDSMAPGLADATRQQLTDIQSELSALGPIETITFRQISQQGLDVYDVKHANGKTVWHVMISPEGKILTAQF